MTMTKKRLLLFASLPLSLAVAIGVLAMLPPRPGVTKANFDRIQEGMSRAEVEEIFGQEGVVVSSREGKHKAVRWLAEDGSTAGVLFVEDWLLDKDWHDSNEAILDKIRRWLHLP